MIKVYEVSRKYIMLFMHNNRYTFNWFIYFVAVNYTACEIFEIFQKYFTKYEAFHAKKFREILHRFLVDCQSVSEVRAVYETHR